MALERNVIATVPKGPDVLTQVSLVSVGGEEFIELADLIVSTGRFGRGYHFPADRLGDVARILKTAADRRVFG